MSWGNRCLIWMVAGFNLFTWPQVAHSLAVENGLVFPVVLTRHLTNWVQKLPICKRQVAMILDDDHYFWGCFVYLCWSSYPFVLLFANAKAVPLQKLYNEGTHYFLRPSLLCALQSTAHWVVLQVIHLLSHIPQSMKCVAQRRHWLDPWLGPE